MNSCLWLLVSFISWAHVVLSLSNVGDRTRPIFPMDDGIKLEERKTNDGPVNHRELQMGDATAKLSNWIYKPFQTSDKKGPMTPLPKGMYVERDNICMASSTSIQWAVVTSDETVYVVFRGSHTPTDFMIVNAATTPIRTFDGKSNVVHGGAWNALHSVDDMATDEIKVILEAAITTNPNIKVVLCGHSLGGAYAILCALELLHEDDGVKVDHVIGHGPPQVIKPNTANKVWNELNRITTIYVNEYDVVPRLPSCHEEWRETLEKLKKSPGDR